VLSAGDHVLVTDDVYRPSRNFCNGMLARYGVEVSYFDPLIGTGIESPVQAQHQSGWSRRPARSRLN
jgi:cystathionine beta-lyase/cystathionine gamma-synthase